MKVKKIIALGIENLALFLISVGLVLGFFFHPLFYKVYAPLLFIGGGIVIVILIWTIVYLRKAGNFLTHTQGVMIFEPSEKDLIVQGLKTLVLFEHHIDSYTPGKLYDAKMDITSRKGFATIKVKEVKHITTDDLTESRIMHLGYRNRKEFLKDWKERHGSFVDTRKVTLISFVVEEVPA